MRRREGQGKITGEGGREMWLECERECYEGSGGIENEEHVYVKGRIYTHV